MIYNTILNNLEEFSQDTLNKYLEELNINYLVNHLSYKFPLRKPMDLRNILIDEYELEDPLEEAN